MIIPVAEDRDVEVARVEVEHINNNTLFTASSHFFKFFWKNFEKGVTSLYRRVVLPVVSKLNETVALLHRRIMLPGGHVCSNFAQSVFREEDVVIMPRYTLTFIITDLFALTQIKSQGGFPSQTHPQVFMVSVTSVICYGLASAAELVISAQGDDHTSVYVTISRFGRMGSLLVLVASLASLFYF